MVNDGKVLHESVGANVRRFVEVGMMVKYSDPERYAEEGRTGLGLERCVKHVFNKQLAKTEGRGLKWDARISREHIQCQCTATISSQSIADTNKDAALDAQASLAVYVQAKQMLRAKSEALGRPIPEEWFTYNFLEGKATRIQQSIRMEDIPWTQTLCPWYHGGRFQQYYM
jgi:hypothetical protein